MIGLVPEAVLAPAPEVEGAGVLGERDEARELLAREARDHLPVVGVRIVMDGWRDHAHPLEAAAGVAQLDLRQPEADLLVEGREGGGVHVGREVDVGPPPDADERVHVRCASYGVRLV